MLFDFDRSNIKPQYYHLLDEVAAVFLQNPGLRVRIEGHTDSIGTAAYNLKLSLRRANPGVNLVVRLWVNTGDYWGVKFDYARAVKEAFDANGIEIPFPQRVIHMVSESNAQ